MSGIPCSRAPIGGGRGWSPVEFDPADGAVVLLDQRRLPAEERYVRARSHRETAEAIACMVVRGAPAIGIAAAYGMVQAARRALEADANQFAAAMASAATELGAARPTAVNLHWALRRMTEAGRRLAGAPGRRRAASLQEEAEELHREDAAACREMGRLALPWIADGSVLMTHCNTGALATGGWGTALGAVRAAVAEGRRVRVLAGETRPYLQGARLTAWELHRDGIEVAVFPDGAAAWLMARERPAAVLVGADRVAANGDVANKIGTYGLALAARAHDVPFLVLAPWSTVDLDTPDGSRIPIEERGREEVARIGERWVVPQGVPCRHPAFDVTPAELVTALITERGVVRLGEGERPSSLVERGSEVPSSRSP